MQDVFSEGLALIRFGDYSKGKYGYPNIQVINEEQKNLLQKINHSARFDDE
jgi:hypothetical protein